MLEYETGAMHSEEEFAALVDALAADPQGHEQLIELLREDHSLYDQRGTSTTVRMRGWVLLALGRAGVSDAALVFLLEELDTGVDAYLIAAAAHSLRSYPHPTSALAPFVMRALTNTRYRDEPITFESYGAYAVSSAGTSAVHELLATLAWLGPHARGVLPELESLSEQRKFSRKRLIDLEAAIATIRGSDPPDESAGEACCTLPGSLQSTFSWPFGSRRSSKAIQATVFEDQSGELVTFKEFFGGQPSIVVFFYTRCDNPWKCSLSITKLGRIQKLLAARGLTDQIRTAAITYDPAYDLPERIRGYGQNRGLLMADGHRMLRTTEGFDVVRRHFKLGVNFIESLINRHRIEIFVLDAAGRIAASFQRIHWDEQQVVNRTIEVLEEEREATTESRSAAEPGDRPAPRKAALPMFGTLASVGFAFFPKCPICWAAYLSVFGIAGLNQIPYSPWLRPVFILVMLINLGSVWLRARTTRRMSGFYLVSAGALAIILSKSVPGWESAAVGGVALTIAGSLFSALSTTNVRSSLSKLLPQMSNE